MGKTKKEYQVGDYRGWMIWAWAGRGASIAINVVVLMQITYYCTDALGMAPGLVGVLLMISKVFDGFTDIMAGFIVDKTHTKLGKARPFELCILGVWVGTVLLFSTPDFGIVGKCIWIVALYTVVNSVFATFLNATDAVYLRRAVRTQEGQGKIMSYSAPVGMVLCAATSIALPILITVFGSRPHGWTIISLLFAVPFSVIGLSRFFFLKEMDVEDEKAQTLTIKDMLKVISTNKYIFIIALSLFVMNLINNIGSGVGNYYFQYIYGNLGMASVVGMLGIITPFCMLFFPMLMKKNSLKKLTMLGAVAGVVGNLVKFAGGTNLPLLVVGNLIAGIGILPLSMLVNIFVIECMDYGEYKNGMRVEGAYGCITGLAGKLGQGFSSIFVGFIMQFAGYNGELEVQSAAANASIIALYAVVPAILFVVMIIVLRFYDLDRNIGEIRQKLAASRS